MSPKRVNDVVLKDSAAKSATLGFVSNESEEQEHNSQSGYVIVGNEMSSTVIKSTRVIVLDPHASETVSVISKVPGVE